MASIGHVTEKLRLILNIQKYYLGITIIHVTSMGLAHDDDVIKGEEKGVEINKNQL